MDIRMEKLIYDLKNNHLNPDSSFRFHCTQCGKCCIYRDDIILSPLDLFRIAKELRLSLEEVLKQYCECYIGAESRFPIVRIKPRGSVRRCPFLKNRKCLIQNAKPDVCAMFPIGRGIRFDTDSETESQKPAIEYFYTNPGCGDDARTQTLQEWFDQFHIPLEDEFFIAWTTFRKEMIGLLKEAESLFREMAMPQIWNPMFGVLYLCYHTEKEFYPQFQKNTANLLESLQGLLSRKAIITENLYRK